MLVLTRKSNQSIMIGDDIEVSVLSIMGEKVRIGIQAPRDVPVFRKEVYLEIQAGARRGHGRRARASPPRSSSTGSGASAAAVGLAHHVVQRLEHRHRDQHGGGDEREHERDEPHRAVLVGAFDLALTRHAGRCRDRLLGAHLLDLRLLDEGPLDLREALAHPHGDGEAYRSTGVPEPPPGRPTRARARPRSRRGKRTLGGNVAGTA